MRSPTYALLAAGLLSLGGCGREATTSREQPSEPAARQAAPAAPAPAAPQAASHGARAEAVLAGTQPGSPISGTVSFTETAEGLRVEARVTNAPPGPHGFHVHEHGNCGGSGAAAGGHYNPRGVPHGYLPRDGAGMAHGGDMGNLDIGADGSGTASLVMPGLRLTKEPTVLRRAVILHELGDDFGQPTGNAGGRIACGVIEARN